MPGLESGSSQRIFHFPDAAPNPLSTTFSFPLLDPSLAVGHDHQHGLMASISGMNVGRKAMVMPIGITIRKGNGIPTRAAIRP